MKLRIFFVSLMVLVTIGVVSFWQIASLENYNASDFEDLEILKTRAAEGLHVFVVAEGARGFELPEHQWSTEFRALNPVGVRVTREGLWIRLDKFFVTESGIFFPRDKIDPGMFRGDPALYFIEHGVFGYHIRG